MHDKNRDIKTLENWVNIFEMGFFDTIAKSHIQKPTQVYGGALLPKN